MHFKGDGKSFSFLLVVLHLLCRQNWSNGLEADCEIAKNPSTTKKKNSQTYCLTRLPPFPILLWNNRVILSLGVTPDAKVQRLGLEI